VSVHKIALIGTGLLGHSIAERWLLTNHSLLVYNRTAAKAMDLVSLGAKLCSSVSETIEAANAIFLILSDATVTKNLLFEPNVRTAFHGKTFFQMGTISPEESEELALKIQEKGGSFVELPVLGSKNEAKSGTLLLMFGGSEEEYHRWYTLLSALGKVFFTGDPRKAAVLKLALNQLIISSIIAFSTSLSMVLKERIDPELFMEILRKSSLYCATFDKKLPRILNKDYSSANFTLKLLLKDLTLCLKETEKLSIQSEPLKAYEKLIQMAIDQGFENSDYSSVFEAIYQTL